MLGDVEETYPTYSDHLRGLAKRQKEINKASLHLLHAFIKGSSEGVFAAQHHYYTLQVKQPNNWSPPNSPSKRGVTIPRLELVAARTLTNLPINVNNALHRHFSTMSFITSIPPSAPSNDTFHQYLPTMPFATSFQIPSTNSSDNS